MRFSSICLWRLMAQSSSAYPSASSPAEASRVLTAIAASDILPAAFILGAIPKPIKPEVIFLFFAWESSLFFEEDASISAASPGRGLSSMILSPMLTISLFSSTIGITSAIVPSAVRSAYFEHTSLIPSTTALPLSRHLLISQAHTSLNTTPTPARSLKG